MVHSWCYTLYEFGQMNTDMDCYYGIIQSIFTVLKSFVLCLFIPPTFPPLPTIPGNCWSFYCLHSFAFSRMSYSWHHIACSLFRLTFSLSYIHLGFHNIFSWLDSSFFFISVYYSIVWMYHYLFIYSLTEGHLSCFQVLAIMSKAVINICVQVFVWT